MISAAAPSLIPDALPAVTVPSGPNSGFKAASPSSVVSARGCSSVLISSVSPSVEQGNILTEDVSIKYSKVKWKYTQQKVNGGTGGNTSGGWDLSANKIAA